MNSIGDIRIMGLWTGWSEDMSTGLIGGFKLPSGDWHYPPFDRDTQIGTGSTDLLLGGYHIGRYRRAGNLAVDLLDRPVNCYCQGQYDLPFAYQDHYKPGPEFDGRSAPITTSAKLVRSMNSLRYFLFSASTGRGIRGERESRSLRLRHADVAPGGVRNSGSTRDSTQTSRFQFFRT